MTDSNRQRPLSPHLTVYKPQITSVTSIMHRITGVALTFAAFIFACWLGCLAAGPEAFATMQSWVGSWLGKFALFAVTWMFAYHLANGIRHLFWDAGKGYDIGFARTTGWVVIISSLVITLLIWLFALGAHA